MHLVSGSRIARHLLVPLSFGLAPSACSGDPDGCVANQQLDCTTSNGSRGVQVCGDDGAYGSCRAVDTGTGQPIDRTPVGAGGGSVGGTGTAGRNGASGSGVNPPSNDPQSNDPQVADPVDEPRTNGPLPMGDAQAAAFLANSGFGWKTEDPVFTSGFSMLLCDSGVVSFVQHRDTDIGVDTIFEDFSFLGFWTAESPSSSEVVAHAQFFTSNDDDRPAPFRQDFSIGLRMPVTVDGAPVSGVTDRTADCAAVMTNLTQQCAQTSTPFCTELRARQGGAAPAPAPAPGEASQCSAVPSPPNACSACGASSCCDELTVCGPGTPCDALLTCLTLCPTGEDSCVQSACDPIAAQGADAVVELGTCLQDFCTPECTSS